MEEVDLPFKEGEIDIIVSEWMGYFLLYESMRWNEAQIKIKNMSRFYLDFSFIKR